MTKGLVTASLPEIPVDSIGSPLPATIVACPADITLSRLDPAVREDLRAAGPRAGPGRADSARRLLAEICVRTT